MARPRVFPGWRKSSEAALMRQLRRRRGFGWLLKQLKEQVAEVN